MPWEKGIIGDIKAAVSLSEDIHKDALQMMTSLHITKEVSWELLWTIFPPNTLVYTKNSVVSADQVLKLLHCKKVVTAGNYKKGPVTSWVLTCQFLGVIFKESLARDSLRTAGYCTKEFAIDEYPGVERITNLKIYPLSFVEFRINLERLTLRGKKYIQMLAIGYCQVQTSSARDELPHDSNRKTSQKDCPVGDMILQHIYGVDNSFRP